MMPSAASVLTADPSAGGSMAWVPRKWRRPAATSAKVDASATTRRDADSAASSGTTTSQIAAKEAMPPVSAATAVTSPVSASDDSTWALSYWPVRDKK